MTFASKNLKLFSSYYTSNNKNTFYEPTKMKFISEDTDGRMWCCNSFKRQQYFLEIMSEKKNRRPMSDANVTTRQTHTAEDHDGCGILKIGLHGDGVPTKDSNEINLQTKNSSYFTPDSEFSEIFTVRFEETNVPKLNSNQLLTKIEIKPSNHSLKVHYTREEYCSVCKKRKINYD